MYSPTTHSYATLSTTTKHRCDRGRAFFTKHSFQLVLAWHSSITIGFSLNNLLTALVFTNNSGTPKKALARYVRTFAFLAEWHLGDVWDAASPSDAYSSVATVRSLHRAVRSAMDKSMPGKRWMTMYDMALVQTGFMGAITIEPSGFGLHVTQVHRKGVIVQARKRHGQRRGLGSSSEHPCYSCSFH